MCQIVHGIMGVDFKDAVLKLLPHINLEKEYVETVREKPAELSDKDRHLDLYNQLKELNFDSDENKLMRQSIAYLTKLEVWIEILSTK